MVASPRSTTVVYRGLGSFATLFGLAVVLLIASALVRSMIQDSADVSFDCSRASGECLVVSKYALVGSRAEVHPLASIGSTKLDSLTDKHGSTYAVQLESTSGGTTPVSSRYGDLGPRARQKQAIDAFLADPTQPTLHVDYDTGTFSTGKLVGLCLFLPLAGYVLGARTRLRFDATSGMLHVERGIGGWARKRQTIPLGEIQGFAVESEDGSKGESVYRAVIVMGSGRTIPLLGLFSGGQQTHEDAVDRMRVAFATALGDASRDPV